MRCFVCVKRCGFTCEERRHERWRGMSGSARAIDRRGAGSRNAYGEASNWKRFCSCALAGRFQGGKDRRHKMNRACRPPTCCLVLTFFRSSNRSFFAVAISASSSSVDSARASSMEGSAMLADTLRITAGRAEPTNTRRPLAETSAIASTSKRRSDAAIV